MVMRMAEQGMAMEGDKSRALDAYLVASARLGDRKAFELLVRRWHRKLVAHAWRLLHDDEAARDCTQAAWAEIIRSLPKLRDDRAFAAWACRIVSRRCARHIHGLVSDRRFAEENAYSAELSASPTVLPGGRDLAAPWPACRRTNRLPCPYSISRT